MNYKDSIKNQFLKEPYIYPALEECHPDCLYALTISPIVQCSSYLEQYRHLESDIAPLFNGEIQLRPELSTKRQFWHWHGTLLFPKYVDVVTFYRNISRLKNICTFTIKPIDCYWQWYLYCIKQRPFLKPYIIQSYPSTSRRKPSLIPYCFRNYQQCELLSLITEKKP
jgi:hypothetical protein